MTPVELMGDLFLPKDKLIWSLRRELAKHMCNCIMRSMNPPLAAIPGHSLSCPYRLKMEEMHFDV
jgi:hypothetical protein